MQGDPVTGAGLRLRLLEPLVERDGAPLETDTPKATALLAYRGWYAGPIKALSARS